MRMRREDAVEKATQINDLVMYLCRAAWYLGESAVICDAATKERTGHEIDRPGGWPRRVHANCGWVKLVDVEEPDGT